MKTTLIILTLALIYALAYFGAFDRAPVLSSFAIVIGTGIATIGVQETAGITAIFLILILFRVLPLLNSTPPIPKANEA